MTVFVSFIVGFFAALLLRHRVRQHESADVERDTAIFALRQLTLAVCAREQGHSTPTLQARAYALAQAVLSADLDRRFPNRRKPRQPAPAAAGNSPPTRPTHRRMTHADSNNQPV